MGVQAHTAHMNSDIIPWIQISYQVSKQYKMNLQPLLSANFFFIELYRIILKYYVTINDLR